VADIIVASLLVDGTPVPRKVARLHLICDILHNSAATVPSAWKFRQEFQARLGIVFDHMANIYHSFPGRITAETFKKQITSIVDVWEDWIVFSPDFTSELRARLEGNTIEDRSTPAIAQQPEDKAPTYSSRFKASTFQAASSAESSEQYGTSVDDVDGVALDDVDGVPLDDIDGAPIEEDDVDGAPMEDVDGEPMDDVDGETMEDVDGVPMEEA
jgi:U2-associated protein SR140